jgi:undecaprenyl-diphosphatase
LAGTAWSASSPPPSPPYLAFLVGLHVATALALLVFFRTEWVRIVAGLWRSLRRRRIETPDERLGWLLVVATIPAGLVGVAFEHALRTLFAKPLAAAVFLTCNGLILLAGEWLRRRASGRQALAARLDPARLHATVGLVEQGAAGQTAGQQLRAGRARPTLARPAAPAANPRLASLAVGDAVLIGATQILAFFAGISRSGATIGLRIREPDGGLGGAKDAETVAAGVAWRLAGRGGCGPAGRGGRIVSSATPARCRWW